MGLLFWHRKSPRKLSLAQSATDAPTGGSVSIYEEEAGVAIKALALNEVLRRHHGELDRIATQLGFSAENWQRLIAPAIRAYTAHVHLLPASEHYHHNRPGGLLYHTLEVAHLAVRACDGKVIAEGASAASQRRRLEPRWAVTMLLAALSHDIGKVFSDMEVFAGGYHWNPHRQSLIAWCDEHHIENYSLRWNPGRHGQHKQVALLALDKIIHPELKQWLNAEGGVCYTALLSYLSGDASETVITPILTRADEISVKKDLARNKGSANETAGRGNLAETLTGIIQHIVATGTWGCNVAGSRLYLSGDDAWIIWPAACDAIVEMLRQRSINGIPFDPSRIADVLVECGLCTPQSMKLRQWIIRMPEVTGANKLTALRGKRAIIAPSKSGVGNVKVDIEGVGKPGANDGSQIAVAEPNKTEAIDSQVKDLPAQNNQKTSATEVDAAWFDAQSEPAGKHLAMLVRQVQRRLVRAHDIYESANEIVWLYWPEAFQTALKPSDVVASLAQMGWLDGNSNLFPQAKDLRPGRKGVPLKKDISGRFLRAIGAPVNQVETPSDKLVDSGDHTDNETDEQRKGRELAAKIYRAIGEQAERQDEGYTFSRRALDDLMQRLPAKISGDEMMRSLKAAGCKTTSQGIWIPGKLVDVGGQHDTH